jgi:hypothetical protein
MSMKKNRKHKSSNAVGSKGKKKKIVEVLKIDENGKV